MGHCNPTCSAFLRGSHRTVGRTFRQTGVRPRADWLLAEGADGPLLSRSIPMTKAMDDTMVAYAQNGEAIRPEQGYPFRLLNPGWEGNTSVKWLRRIEVGDAPWLTRQETSKYTDALSSGKVRQFSFTMDARSIINMGFLVGCSV